METRTVCFNTNLSHSINANERPAIYQFMAQVCADNGAPLSSGPQATWSAKAGGNDYPGNWGGKGWSGWGPSDSGWDKVPESAWKSYTSAHPSGPSSGDWSSFTSAYSITKGPWGDGTPTGGWGAYVTGKPGGWGGWGMGSGPGGWDAADGCPFGDNGWGSGPWVSGGAWTSGAWTSWWDGDKCPGKDWEGWTSGSWSTGAPWTSWTACEAKTTGAKVYTTTINGVPSVATSYGLQLAQAASEKPTLVGSGNAAAPTGNPRALVGGAAAAAGFVGAVLAM